MKGCVAFVVFLLFSAILIYPAKLLASNNIFGIHIINETDLEDAAKLVNSSGGEWGYVTLVIREDERDVSRWQNVFDKIRELKLIPIVRIATKTEGESWKKPTKEDAESWTNFLSSLNWVVKDRYVILFNEPNHIGEWGGTINPAEYAEVAKAFQKRLKESSSEFFILPAGFDSSAPNSSTTMSADIYWDMMATDDANIFSIFDGWSSHSYPNPAFSSSPTLSGRGTVRSFSWEVSFLSKYGLRQNLPIFITETGWVHNENKESKVLGLNSETVGNFFKNAYANAWSDKRIKAVTPFVLNYPAKPFDDFSWKKKDSSEYLPHFAVVQGLAKIKGTPTQIHKNILSGHNLPQKAITNSFYDLNIKFKNTGQSIWSEANGFSPDFKVDGKKYEIDSFLVSNTKPGSTSEVQINFHTPEIPGTYQVSVQMQYKDHLFGDLLTHAMEIVDPPKLKVTAASLFNFQSSQEVKLLVYKDNNVVHEIENFSLESGETDLRDVSPGEAYRFVLVKPYHLPVQTHAEILIPETKITFPLLLPVDRDNDGKLSWGDLSIF